MAITQGDFCSVQSRRLLWRWRRVTARYQGELARLGDKTPGRVPINGFQTALGLTAKVMRTSPAEYWL